MRKALLFAAGKGERLRPLTDRLPKALVEVGGRPLIFHHLDALKKAGFKEVVVNLSHRGEQIREALGDGSDWKLRLQYSEEGPEPLETGGGMRQALDLLGPDDEFAAINADIYTNFDYRRLRGWPAGLAHLILVPNPPHNPRGDFALEDGHVLSVAAGRLTFSGIGAYRPEFISGYRPGTFKLAPVLRTAIAHGVVSGELFEGIWMDVGTPERLAEANAIAEKRARRRRRS
jgi:MurNAc alpha-1-phosphate uridylyltransferase